VGEAHQFSDAFQFNSAMFSSTQALLDAIHDGGHDNHGIHSNDVMAFGDVHKALGHIGDFHIV
jgi:hypothetical protein